MCVSARRHGIIYQKNIERLFRWVRRPCYILASLNARGCNQWRRKATSGSIMSRRKLDELALSDTNWKGKGIIVCGNVESLRSGANENEHAEEGIAIRLSKDILKCVKGSEEVSFGVIWVRLELYSRY